MAAAAAAVGRQGAGAAELVGGGAVEQAIVADAARGRGAGGKAAVVEGRFSATAVALPYPRVACVCVGARVCAGVDRTGVGGVVSVVIIVGIARRPGIGDVIPRIGLDRPTPLGVGGKAVTGGEEKCCNQTPAQIHHHVSIVPS